VGLLLAASSTIWVRCCSFGLRELLGHQSGPNKKATDWRRWQEYRWVLVAPVRERIAYLRAGCNSFPASGAGRDRVPGQFAVCRQCSRSKAISGSSRGKPMGGSLRGGSRVRDPAGIPGLVYCA
jgi:hypothetical protein